MTTTMMDDVVHASRPQHPVGMPWANLENVPLSQWYGASGVILVVICILFSLIRHYILTTMIIPALYPTLPSTLTPRNLRTFTNHHLSFIAKIAIFLIAAYPFFRIVVTGADLNTPCRPGGKVTLGDVMVVVTHIFTVMYVHELSYREGISYICWMHHSAAAVMSQMALWLSVNAEGHGDSAMELVVCWIWGIFDLLAEAWPHLTMILYRSHPTSHLLLLRAFRTAFILTVLGTVAETAIIVWILAALWGRWSLALKIATPVLQGMFMAAQGWGSWKLLGLWRKRAAIVKELEEDKEKGC